MSTQEGGQGASTPSYLAITGKQIAHDPSVYEEISAPRELIATPVGRGSFGHYKTYLITPAVVAYQESFDSAVRVRDLTPAGMLGFLRDKDTSSLSIPQLSTIAGVGQRTLEYAFRETFDLTPLGFLRLKRFHGTRRMLMSTRQGEATVADITHRNGFYELGRFATSYKQLFGELPSQTMALPPVETTSNPFLTFR